jgi:hypothetical protein
LSWQLSWCFSGGCSERAIVPGKDPMKSYVLPFLITLAASGALFLVLDLTVMRLMGLTLFFHP